MQRFNQQGYLTAGVGEQEAWPEAFAMKPHGDVPAFVEALPQ